MIKFKRLPADIEKRLPSLYEKLKAVDTVCALYTFGSLVKGHIGPLSDIDLAILLTKSLNKKQIFEIELEIVGIVMDTLKTEEFDLIILNTAPPRFAYYILKEGRLILCKDRMQLVDFTEKTVKYFIDFKFYRRQFDKIFLEGIGYYG